MIKVNLLRNRMISAGAQSAQPGAVASAGEIKDFELDEGFYVFEASQMGQIVKILLMVSFVVPLVVFEKMRGNQGKEMLIAKQSEVESIREIRSAKEEELIEYSGLKEKKAFLKIRDQELRAVKSGRLLTVESMDAVQTAIPSGVWLLSIKFVSDSMSITGQTFDQNGLNLFVEQLKRTGKFANVNVQKDVRVETESKKVVNEFLITLAIEKEPGEEG